ncbi:FadR/GntR family transcriptional regulator [Actinomadura mexicana]|uniref:DNA-binding transcriptional regulator, FadR family n=1 Tax=Actinomadura mexicana TaxID=134959 RepID=A0A238Y900_9ACTN|nr:FCD domain-containing protein [Actinomadura mexicana]SNR67725.1 DNA-binding transcriptional regulator, FadR family [Actinomadura mexicana]
MDSAHLVVFAPVDNTARVHAVVRRLSDAIALGLLADGEQLPSETDLSAFLGVSTVTLREALMALRQQGLIETRRGRGGGSFVRAPTRAFDLDERLRSLSAEELRDLGDHYAAIAGAAARLAAGRSLPGDVRRLRRSLEEMAGAGPSGAGMCRLDGRLHLEVAAASQSGRLTREEIRLQAEIGPLVWAVHDLPERRGRVDAEHARLVEAIEAADGAGARDVAESHVSNAVERLIERRLAL